MIPLSTATPEGDWEIVPTTPPAEVWERFKEIESVVIARYGKPSDRPESELMEVRWNLPNTISKAMTLLCSAIIFKFDLRVPGYSGGVFILDSGRVREMPLSTIEEMVGARIPIRERKCSEIKLLEAHEAPDILVLQTSLQSTLDRDYAILKAIVDTTPTQALDLYLQVEKIARAEISRIQSTSFQWVFSTNNERRIQDIQNATSRLHQALLHKYSLPKPTDVEFEKKIDPTRVQSIDLFSVDSMLDAKLPEVEVPRLLPSLREVLDTSIYAYVTGLWSS
jgi:hypothetical protein